NKQVALTVAVEVADKGGRMPVTRHIQRFAADQHWHRREELGRIVAGKSAHDQGHQQTEHRHRAPFLCPRTRSMSQTRAVPSLRPVMSCLQSGEKTIALGPESKPVSLSTGASVAASRTRTSPRPRPKPTARSLPSGENATAPASDVGIFSS